MENAVLSDVAPREFFRSDVSEERVPSLQFLSTLKIEATCTSDSTETSVLTRSTWHHISEDVIIQTSFRL
jgi:hypothetical protein